jgi:hypothetical protein
MSLSRHLEEFMHRIGAGGLCLLVAGLTAGIAAERLWPLLATFVYGVPVQDLLLLLPPRPLRDGLIGVFAACWLGVPAVAYQVWCFVRAGLYSHEKRLALPVLYVIGGGLVSMPLLAAGVSALVRSADAHATWLDLGVAGLLTATHRWTAALVLVLVWSVGLYRVRRLLAQRAREQYVLHLTEGRPIRRRQTSSAKVGRALLLSGLLCTSLAVALPLQVTAASLAGLCWTLCVLAVWFWIFGRIIVQGRRELGKRAGPFQLGFFGAQMVPYEWTGLWLPFFFGLWLLDSPGSWLGPLLGPAGRVAAAVPGTSVWHALVVAAWAGRLVTGIARWGLDLFIPALRSSVAKSPGDRWQEALGGLVSFGVLASPVLTCRLWWTLLGLAAPHLAPVVRSGLSIRLAILPLLAVIAGGAFLVFRMSSRGLVSTERAALFLVFAISACLPTLVLAGIVVFAGYLTLILVPEILAFLSNLGAGDLWTGMGRAVKEFHRASRELTSTLRHEIGGEG